MKCICPKCGIEFENDTNRKFCSRKCANSHIQTEKQNEKRSLKLKGKYFKEYTRPKYLYCKFCNSLLTNRKRKFCNDECLKNWKRRNKSEFQKYKSDCQFNFALKNYPEEFDFTLIEKYGWYKASNHGNNLKGISKDHMYSVYDGYKNNIDSKIISHPANCQLMQQTKNSSKYKKSSITLEELLERIKKWNKKYGGNSIVG